MRYLSVSRLVYCNCYTINKYLDPGAGTVVRWVVPCGRVKLGTDVIGCRRRELASRV